MTRGITILAVLFTSLGAAEVPQMPQNLDFRDGAAGASLRGWALTGAGYSAEEREGCGCAVILPPSGGSSSEANLTQTVGALLLRGRMVYLKASLRAEAAAVARLWIRVNRPGNPPGLFDNLSDEAVRGENWTGSEVRVPVNADAESIDFGVSSSGGGAVWIREMSLEVAGDGPEGRLEPVGPVNLGFMNGEPGHTPLFWWVEPAPGSAAPAVILRQGCKVGPVCVAVTAPWSMMQGFSAVAYRGKTVRLRAWARSEASGRVWLRTDSASMLRRTEYHDVTGGEWAQVTLTHRIEDDAQSTAIGLTAFGKGDAQLDGVYLDVIPDGAALPGSLTPTPILPVTTEPAPEPVTVSRSIAAPVARQTRSGPVPPLADQTRIVNLAAARGAVYTAELPDFICTQVVKRSEKRDIKSWRLRDTLIVQLGYADRAEHYKLIAVNRRPTSASYRSMGGTISEGEFGSVIREIFRPHATKFVWDRQETLRNRRVAVFSYSVAKEKSDYLVQYGSTVNSAHAVVVGHHGFIYVDPGTGEVLRLVRIADLPKGFPITNAQTILDYDESAVGDRSYLLPLKAQLDLDTAHLLTRNEIEYRDYRKFESNSSITYDETPR